jgi:hypothetical protein
MGFETIENEEGENLTERMRQAIIDAQSLEDADKHDREMALVINDFISGRIGLDEFSEINEAENDISRPGTVEFSNLEEMCDSLGELLGDEEIARELTDHERCHFDKVIEVGWMARILCRFFKDESNDISLRPGILPDIPKSGNEEEIRNKLRSIIEAPHDQSDMDEMSTKGV